MRKVKGPWILASAIALALIVSPFAIAAGEGNPLLGGKRNPGTNESQALSSETEIIANNGTYGTRQSNKSDNGGGAIYGCRSKAGGTPKANEPCIRASNLADGRAFEFESKGGSEVGAIVSSNTSAAPFTTNATGVATGLNADRVDSKSADEIAADGAAAAKTAYQAANKFASVTGDTGALAAGRGAKTASRTAAGVYTVDFDSAVNACAQTATIRGEAPGAVTVSNVDEDTLTVRTFAVGGATNGDPADRSFHLQVTC
ncbi:MAG: hypothetical protein HZB46_04685 [Solirubrobacterales bacterium]|nr:hypothetical protein [Solirubrobacterales bacterium]